MYEQIFSSETSLTLQDLEASYKALIENPNSRLRHEFNQKLWVAHIAQSESNEISVKSELLKYWLYDFNYMLTHNVEPEYVTDEVDDIDAFVSFIIRNAYVESLVNDSETRCLLAAICTKRALRCWHGYEHPKEQNISTLVKAITGVEPAPSALETLQAMVIELYGEATWHLYHQDVETKQHIPGYFLKIGLSPIGPKLSDTYDTGLGCLPNEML